MIQQSPEAVANALVGDWVEFTTRGGAEMWVDVREVVRCNAEIVLVRYTPSPQGDIY